MGRSEDRAFEPDAPIVWRMSGSVRPVLVAVSLMGLSVALAPAATAAPAKAGKQSVEGKVSWTVVTTYKDDGDPSNPSNVTQDETTEETHSLQIKAMRDPQFTRTYVFKQGKASYSYAYQTTRVTKDYGFSQLRCETTTRANASGSGKTDMSPSVFGKYNPNKDVLVIDKRTKGISVGASLPGSGTSTTEQKGFGLSPCQEGSWTDPIDEDGGTGLNNANDVCLPKGLKRPGSSLRPLFGKWNNAKKRFDFKCSETFVDSTGMQTTRITISGSLKYKR